MTNTVIVTGCNGGIGSEISKFLQSQGYLVIGIDQADANNPVDLFYSCNLEEVIGSKSLQEQLLQQVENFLEKHQAQLYGLINNAATQQLSSLEQLNIEAFQQSLAVNVTAPLVLSQLLLGALETSKGSIINIGSIHAQQTKKAFISYATSKAALAGLTRSLAVDLEGRVRVNCIEPAAIDTPMLQDGFKEQPEKLELLASCHPSGKIGQPQEIAALCAFLLSEQASFINGVSIPVNGAISSRLHDPV